MKITNAVQFLGYCSCFSLLCIAVMPQLVRSKNTGLIDGMAMQ